MEEAKAGGADKTYLEVINMARRLYTKVGFEHMEDYMKLRAR